MLVETCNPVVDASPPLLDGDVEHRALDGYQPGMKGLVDGGRHPSSSRWRC